MAVDYITWKIVPRFNYFSTKRIFPTLKIRDQLLQWDVPFVNIFILISAGFFTAHAKVNVDLIIKCFILILNALMDHTYNLCLITIPTLNPT